MRCAAVAQKIATDVRAGSIGGVGEGEEGYEDFVVSGVVGAEAAREVPGATQVATALARTIAPEARTGSVGGEGEGEEVEEDCVVYWRSRRRSRQRTSRSHTGDNIAVISRASESPGPLIIPAFCP